MTTLPKDFKEFIELLNKVDDLVKSHEFKLVRIFLLIDKDGLYDLNGKL